MKTGINQWAFPSGMPFRNAVKLAAEAGFETFEVAVGEAGPVSLDTSEKDATAMARYARRLGVELVSAASGLGWQYPLSSPDKAVRAQGAEALEKTLQIAQWLGAGSVLVVPGVVTPEVGYDVAVENALAEIQRLRPAAEKLRVAMAIENVWNKFLLSPLEMRDFIDQCESEYVGAFFDIGNIVLYGFPEQWIRILGGRIKSVHAKDFRASAGNMDGFVMLLEGDVDWPAVVAALNDVGYAGPLTAEYGAYTHSLETTLQHCKASLDTIIALGT